MTLECRGELQQTEVAMVTNRSSIILCVALLTGILAAQSPRTQAVLMAMKANASQLASWQWKQRTTILRKGNQLNAKIDEVRVGTGGVLHRTTLVRQPR
jgi:hypothetical protein